MRLLFVLLLLVSVKSSLAFKEVLQPYYTIISDEKSDSIERGYCLIEGHCRMFSSHNPVIGTQIGGIYEKTPKQEVKDVLTDSLGYFSIKLPVGFKRFCAYRLGFEESCIADYNFKSKHRIQIDIYLHKGRPHVKRKPVIYLYSEEPLSANVQLDPHGEFTFTYPKYNDGWDVEVSEDGQLIDKSNDKEYPYLFWEAESQDVMYQTNGMEIEGFLIKTDTTLSFLSRSLDQLGFNAREKTDFLTFWAPILERDPYALIQFVIDDDYEKRIASLNIQPQPDNLRRVYMIYSPLVDSNFEMTIISQNLVGIDREGFFVLEWGGGKIDLTDLKP
jgi:hypothetical protein